MKFVIQLDAEAQISDAICEVATEKMEPFYNDLDYEERREQLAEDCWDLLAELHCGVGRIRIEFDTEAGTARVLKRDK